MNVFVIVSAIFFIGFAAFSVNACFRIWQVLMNMQKQLEYMERVTARMELFINPKNDVGTVDIAFSNSKRD